MWRWIVASPSPREEPPIVAPPACSARSETGWQPDGSYMPCPACKWEPQPDDGPGRLVRFPGTTHSGDCPTIPRLSREQERELQAKLREMDECRARAWVEARNYVIY